MPHRPSRDQWRRFKLLRHLPQQPPQRAVIQQPHGARAESGALDLARALLNSAVVRVPPPSMPRMYGREMCVSATAECFHGRLASAAMLVFPLLVRYLNRMTGPSRRFSIRIELEEAAGTCRLTPSPISSDLRPVGCVDHQSAARDLAGSAALFAQKVTRKRLSAGAGSRTRRLSH